jgi:methionine-rich copper-binding protein CopC
MRLKKKKMLGIILSLVLVLGLMPGMRLTVEAASYTISPENSGTVSVANKVYTAVPNSGYDFDHWEYDYGIASSSTENPKDFSHYALTGPVKAVFVKQRAKATVTANSFTYDGASHDLVSVSDVVGGTVKYKAADDTWTETIPSGTAAGSYTVTYKIFSTDSEYDDSLEKSVTATIAKATASANVTANALTYNGSAQELVSVSDLVGGTVNYLKEEKTSAVYTSGSVNASALEVGDIVAPGTNNSVSFEGTVLFTGSGYYSSYNGKTFTSIRSENMFDDEEITVEGPGAHIYFFRDYNALRVVSVADGNVYVEPFAYTSTQTYTNKVWTEEIPVGTNVGSYSVTYKIVSNDSNYADSSENTIDDITISKAEVTAPVIASKSYTGELQTADIAESVFYTVTSNDGGTDVGSYDVVLTLKDLANSKWSDSEEAAKTLTFEITKASIDKVIAPGVKELTYTGSAQELITTGSAEGGEMRYALGTNATTAPDASAYTASIPTATDAGTYYVWYKVVGDSNHLDSDAGYVTVTIATADSSDSGSGSSSSGSTDSGSGSGSSGGSSDSGNTSGGTSSDSSDNTNTNTDTSAKVPYNDVAVSTGSVNDITGTAAATAENNPFETKIINNSDEELKTLFSLDTDVAQGVNVWLDIQDMSASVPQTDKTLIQNTSGDYTVGLYLDINLFKKVGSNDATKVTETNGKVKVSIVIPESLRKSGRSFELIRVHDGVATAIAGSYDESTHVFTFETDKFSTYALAYKDPASSSNSGTTSNSSNSTQATAPKTGDSNDIRVWYLLLIASLGGLGFIGYSKKKEN